jgi:hypothetical protein
VLLLALRHRPPLPIGAPVMPEIHYKVCQKKACKNLRNHPKSPKINNKWCNEPYKKTTGELS